MTESRVTGTRSVAIRSLSTLPAPTLGSWSVSPTRSRCAFAGTACRRAEASRASSMEASSTTRKSVASGWDSLLVKPPPAGSYFSSRWIVEAKPPVVSARRCAARPVGAARCTRTFFAFRISTRARKIVVFPVPGPPVRIVNLCVRAWRTAVRWSSWKAKPALSSAHFTAASALIGGRPLATRLRRASTSAIFCSARSLCGSWIRAEPGKGAVTPATAWRMSALLSTRAWMRASTSFESVSSWFDEYPTRSASRKAVWPSSCSVSSAKMRPASRRGAASLAKPRLIAMRSAVLKPMPSISRATR